MLHRTYDLGERLKVEEVEGSVVLLVGATGTVIVNTMLCRKGWD